MCTFPLSHYAILVHLILSPHFPVLGSPSPGQTHAVHHSKSAGAPWATTATQNNGISHLCPMHPRQCPGPFLHASGACRTFLALDALTIHPVHFLSISPIPPSSTSLALCQPCINARLPHHSPTMYHQVSNGTSIQLPNLSGSLALLAPFLSECTSEVLHSALHIA